MWRLRNDERDDQWRARVWPFLALKGLLLVVAFGSIFYYWQLGAVSEAVPLLTALAVELPFVACHALWVKVRPQHIRLANYTSFLLSIIVITVCLSFLNELRALVTAMYFGLVLLAAFAMPQRQVVLQVTGWASAAYLMLNFLEYAQWLPFLSAMPRRPLAFLNGYTFVVVGALFIFAGLIVYLLSLAERAEQQRELAYRLRDDLVRAAEEQTSRLHNISQHLLALQHSTRAMSSTLLLEDLLQLVARECLQTLQVEVAVVLALDEHQAKWTARALAASQPDKVLAAEKMLGASWQALSTSLVNESSAQWDFLRAQQPIFLSDFAPLRRHPLGQKVELALQHYFGMRSLSLVPLTMNTQAIGLIGLLHATPPPLSADDQQIILTFAQHAAVAIHNARLFARAAQAAQENTQHVEKAQRRAAEMTALYDLSLYINTQRNHVGELLQKVAERTVSLVCAQIGFIKLLAPTSDHWIVATVYQMPIELVGFRAPLNFGMASRVAATGKPLVINDYPHWSERSDKLSELNVQSIVAVPLLWEGKTFGVLHVADTQPNRDFTPQEVELLQLFAAQAAAAIKHTQLSEDTLRRLNELSLLYETSQIINAVAPTNPQAMLNQIAQVLAQHKPHWHIAIILKGWGPFPLLVYGSNYELHTPMSEIEARLTRGIGIMGWVFAHGQSQNVPDARNDARYYAYTPSALSELCIPLKAGTQMLGVIDIDCDQLNAFNDDDVRLVTTLANQIATGMDTARRHTALSELYENTRDLAMQRDMPALLETIITRVSALLGNLATELHLYDAATQELTLVLTHNTPMPPGAHTQLGEGLVGRVAQTRQPLIVDDYRTWEGRASFFNPAERGAALAVPMVYGGELIGVLNVYEEGTSRKFTDAEQQLLSLFASQAASAVHGARLLSETAQRANEFATLYDISRELASQQELPKLLETVVERACMLLKTTSANMRLYEPQSNTLGLAIQKNPIADLRPQLQMGEGLAGLVAQTRQPLIRNDYNQWDSRLRTMDTPIAVLGVPMLYRGELIGVLLVIAINQPRQFTEADERLLALFASQAAGAVHGAHLYDTAKRQLSELSLLYDASLTHIGAPSSNLSASLQPLVSTLNQLSHNGNTTILIWDEQQRIILHVREGEAEAGSKETLDLIVSQGRGLTGWVAAHGIPLNVGDVRQDARYFPGVSQTLSELCVPIKIGGQVQGLVNIESPQLNAFDDNDLRMMTTLAAQLAGMIENARLYDELQTQISHLKKAQVQLERSARLAGIGQLAAGIAHEINNPLASILGFSELLHQTVGDDLKGDVEIILKEAQRVRDIVHGLLDFARQREPRKELADLNQLLVDTLKLYRYQFNKARVQTHETCDPMLPLVEVDPNQIKQVLLNLFANATQAMPQGGHLYLATQANGHEIGLTVRDTGTGIAPEHLPHIFEPFFSTKDVGQGTGLGLAISFGIMQNHGGRIEVESQMGVGSCFKLCLPAAPPMGNHSN